MNKYYIPKSSRRNAKVTDLFTVGDVSMKTGTVSFNLIPAKKEQCKDKTFCKNKGKDLFNFLQNNVPSGIYQEYLELVKRQYSLR